MEDYTPSPDEVEETSVERRRSLTGDFLRTWLERRDGDKNDDNKETGGKAKKSKKKAKSNLEKGDDKPADRWSDKLRQVFRNLVSLDLMPVTETAYAAPITSPLAESLADTPVRESDRTIQEPVPPQEEGILAVSADAQRRYYGHELPEADLTPEADESTIEVDDIETDHWVEKAPQPLVAESQNSEETTVDRKPNSATIVPVNHILQRQKTEELERQVKKLKKESKTIKTEQAEITDQQEQFAQQLQERQKAQEKFEQVTVPKMEKARQQLQERLDKPVVKQELPQVKAVIPERPDQKVEVKSELKPVAKPVERLTQPLPELKTQRPITKPVETVMSDSGYNETRYERRHEVMDMPTNIEPLVGTSQITDQATHLTPPPSFPPPLVPPTQPVGNLPMISNNLPTQQAPKPQPGSDMYKQAIRDGFIGGILILVLLGLLALLK